MKQNSNNPVTLKAENLTKVYGSGHTEVVAVRNVSLAVSRGEIVALLGPSGAGKSTLLTLLGLIRPPNMGKIIIDDTIVFENHKAKVNVRTFRRQKFGFVFQKTNLIPFLTAAENVRLAMEIDDQPAKASRKRAMELLEYLGVAERAENMPSQLSGGEQQRVAVARALANRPSLILADEPTAALDSVRGRQVMELFAKVAHEQNAGVIVVTHDHRSLEVFDRTFEMEDGQLRESGSQ
ncbi:MAG: ABC transporter [Planctomycetes bacterium GWF2_41_51]|nr:MAG: ABC transporter [Planctomycetes bacterium GWF2_41_51]HBG26727.1 ABC transporter [Phycisphaerales bacterium]